jgi:hypothetical protein
MSGWLENSPTWVPTLSFALEQKVINLCSEGNSSFPSSHKHAFPLAVEQPVLFTLLYCLFYDTVNSAQDVGPSVTMIRQ